MNIKVKYESKMKKMMNYDIKKIIKKITNILLWSDQTNNMQTRKYS